MTHRGARKVAGPLKAAAVASKIRTEARSELLLCHGQCDAHCVCVRVLCMLNAGWQVDLLHPDSTRDGKGAGRVAGESCSPGLR